MIECKRFEHPDSLACSELTECACDMHVTKNAMQLKQWLVGRCFIWGRSGGAHFSSPLGVHLRDAPFQPQKQLPAVGDRVTASQRQRFSHWPGCDPQCVPSSSQNAVLTAWGSSTAPEDPPDTTIQQPQSERMVWASTLIHSDWSVFK